MRSGSRRNWAMRAGVCAALAALAGCGTTEYVAGTTGTNINLGSDPSIDVFSPENNLSITQGTPVEVTWLAVGTTSYAVVDLFIDTDTDPTNDTETYAYTNLPLTQMSADIDTQELSAGVYHIGLAEYQLGEMVAYAYASATLTINEAPTLFFNSPRTNYRFDRSMDINPTFDVDWTLDTQSRLVTTRIYLDPDGTIDGNEVLLRTSSSQTGDSFSFDLQTAQLEAGLYRILAQITDGRETFSYYAPGSIVLRSRLNGPVDLRDLYLPSSAVRGAVFEGFNPRDNVGSFVTSLKDIDGDGYDDFLIFGQFGKPEWAHNVQGTGIGEGYLVYGRADRFTGLVNLNSTGTLFRGEFFAGVPEVDDPLRPSRGITSFTLLSDWDSDGVREFAFGLPYTDSQSYGVFEPGTLDRNWAPLDAVGYFRTGAVVVAAGSILRPDIGFPGRQVINLSEIGTRIHRAISCYQCSECACPEGFHGPKAPAALCGYTYFHEHWGSEGLTPNEGSSRLGCRFSSADADDQFGETVSTWDYRTIIMAAPNRDPQVSLSEDVTDSVPGAGVISMFFDAERWYPWSNVQAPPANAVFNYPGSVPIYDRWLPHGGPYHYVMDDIRSPGAPGYWVDAEDNEPCIDVIDSFIDTPDRSVRFWSSTPGAHLSEVSGIGDVNADGLFDLVIGAPYSQDGAGACYIVLGRLRELILGGELEVEQLDRPMDSSSSDEYRIFNGIRIVGETGDHLGKTIRDGGDFNRDGYADVLIGSELLNNRRGGAGVFFGSRDAINLVDSEFAFAQLPALGMGVIFVGEEEGDMAGSRVANAGDIDGDGNTDILIAAPNRSIHLDLDMDGVVEVNRTECGAVYLIYGSPDLTGTISLAEVGTERLPGAVFIGRYSGDHLGAGLGMQGDRSFGICGAGDVDGDGYSDLLFGSVDASPRSCEKAGEAYLIYGTGD